MLKRWGAKLSGRQGALEYKRLLSYHLVPNETLEINMAGVKDITPGFAFDCFGGLYIYAKEIGAEIKFTSTPKHLKGILFSGIRAKANEPN